MRKLIFASLLFSFAASVQAQNPADYYYQIPDAPETYTAGTVAARVVDGLGFRFYWATAGLRAEDLAFKPGAESRTSEQTIDHIYNLTFIVMNATKREPTKFPIDISSMTYEQKHKAIMGFIRTASDNLKAASGDDMNEFNMIFQQPDGSANSFPFWNELNGPLSDALWHTGQVVMLRRMSGNPFNSKVSVLSGKVRD